MRVALLTLAGLVALNSALAACAPTRHRVAPYRDDAAVASGLEERAAAYCRAVQPDAELRRCVGAHHSEIVAFLMYLGTRLFAASWVPAHWRWGYGWRWPRAGPDTAEEVHARSVPVEIGPDASVTAREPAELSRAHLINPPEQGLTSAEAARGHL